MHRRGTLRPPTWLGAALVLLAGGCFAPPAPALLRRAETLPTGRTAVSVTAAAYVDNPAGPVAAPELALGLRHALGDGVDGGLTLSLDTGLTADVQLEIHHGPSLVVSLDPRLTLTPPLLQVLVPGATSSLTAVGATLPVTFGIPLGNSELLLGPAVTGWWGHTRSGDTLAVLVGGGVGVDLAVGPVYLVPELDLMCGVGARGPSAGAGDVSGCLGYLAVSFHD